MTPLEMAATAARAMAEHGTLGVVMTLRKGGMPRGFPRGELLNEMQRRGVIERTYSFDPAKVIAWLLKNGLVEMDRTGDRTLSFREPNAELNGGCKPSALNDGLERTLKRRTI